MKNQPVCSIAQLYLSACERHADSLAFRYVEGHRFEAMSYREFRTHALALADCLQTMGVGPGDRVLLLSENRPEWAVCDFALAVLGAVNVPVHSVLSAEQISQVIEDAEPSVAIVSGPETFERLRPGFRKHMDGRPIISFDRLDSPLTACDGERTLLELIEGSEQPVEPSKYANAIDPDSVMSITFTSGTTGRQKGVPLTHRNLASNAMAGLRMIPYAPGDRFLSVLPLSHVYERIAGYYTVLHSGGAIHYIESAEQFVPTAKAWRPTTVVAVPRLFEKVQEAARAQASVSPVKAWVFDMAFNPQLAKLPGATRLFDSLVYSKIRASLGGECRYAVLGGAKVPMNVSAFFERVGIPLLEGYGLTETSPIVSTNGPADYQRGTVGRVLECVQVRFADDGEIEVSGASVMRGYVKDEDNSQVFTADGWLKTGDLGHLTEDGRLVITGRKKDIIVLTTGKKVAPVGIEEALTSSPYISQACVAGDGRKHICAVIVPALDALSRTLGQVTEACLAEGGRAHAFLAEEATRATARLSSVERVRAFVVAAQPFTQENDLVTPTLKLKRRQILDHYEPQIEALYR